MLTRSGHCQGDQFSAVAATQVKVIAAWWLVALCIVPATLGIAGAAAISARRMYGLLIVVAIGFGVGGFLTVLGYEAVMGGGSPGLVRVGKIGFVSLVGATLLSTAVGAPGWLPRTRK